MHFARLANWPYNTRMVDSASVPKTISRIKATAAPGMTLAPRQLKAIQALMAGGTFRSAAKAAGTNPQVLARWMNEDEDFAAEYRRQSETLRKALVNQIVSAGSDATETLLKMVRAKNPGRKLAAAKSVLTAATTLVKSTVEAQDGVRVAPLFVLPPGSVVSLDTEIPPIPDDRALDVVDATLIGARPLDVVDAADSPDEDESQS